MKIRLNFLDIETTGISQEKGHRIIEIAMGIVETDETYESWRLVGDRIWTQRINPKRSIDEAAQAVHHISLADLKGAPEWDAVAPKIKKLMLASDLLVAHNMDFDGPFIALELMRIGETVPDRPSFCTMKAGRGASPMGEVPSLKKLCHAMDVEYNPELAHAADYDVQVMIESFFAGVKLGMFEKWTPASIEKDLAAA